ncbi:hypothetical protein ACH4NO_36600 [Streptomyces olivaceus]|uniref:hypothetical protein n=1 Tax=Streptomyces olivaceus TaxID=47716 RepID=UPI001CCF0643|nr:hypothetical protein [Streptomyces olivaceus]
MPDANGRALHVLAPAPARTATTTAAAAPTPAALDLPTVPVERLQPPDGYRRAIEAHRQAAPPSRVGPGIAEAVERQTRAMRGLSHRAFLEPNIVADNASAPIEQARTEWRRQADVSHAAARAEKNGKLPSKGRAPAVR